MTFVVGAVVAGAAYGQPGQPDVLGPMSAGVKRVAAAEAGPAKARAAEQPGTGEGPTVSRTGEGMTVARLSEGLTVRVLPPIQRKALNIEFGLRIEAVDPAADITGRVNPGDVIVAVNDDQFSSLEQFNALLARHKPGSTVALLVRRGEARIYVPMKLVGK